VHATFFALEQLTLGRAIAAYAAFGKIQIVGHHTQHRSGYSVRAAPKSYQ
jgi:hypothetical protein